MMKIIKQSVLISVMALALFSAAGFAGAQDGGVGVSDPKSQQFQLVPCTGVLNPDGSGKVCDFNQVIVAANRIIKFLLFLSIPLILGMILYTGFKYLTAGGDTMKLAEAKKMFLPVAVGLFWVLGAYLVVYTFLDKLVADKIGGVDKKDIIFLDVKK